MAEILKVLELAHQHGVAEVQIGRGGIKAGLYAQRLAGLPGSLQALLQVGDPDDFSRTLLQVIELLIYRREVHRRLDYCRHRDRGRISHGCP